jgi:hypothetical protein
MSSIDYETAIQNYFNMKNSKTCAGCSRRVKPIFKYEDGVYYAICGHKEPCNLDIQIQKHRTKKLYPLIQEIFQALEENKQDIMELKVKFMFQFINEEVLLREFKALKENLKQLKTKLDSYIAFQHTNLSNKVIIFSNNIETCLEKNKQLYKTYKTTNNKTTLNELLDNVINNINPCLKLKRDLLYSYINMEESIHNKNENVLVKKKRNENIEWEIIEPKVIQYKLR